MNQLLKVKNLWLVFFVLFLASCTNTEPPKKVEQAAPAPVEASSASHTQKITIAGMKFDPAVIDASAGDTLIFTNKDLVAHNVTQFPDNKWASPTLQPGDSWTLIPKQSDSFYCSIHPTMKGDIKVK